LYPTVIKLATQILTSLGSDYLKTAHGAIAVHREENKK